MWRGNHGKQSIHKRTGNAVLRVLIKPDKWADRNLIKFNQIKCTILHLRHKELTQQAGWSQLDEKQLLAWQERTWECYCTAHWPAFSNTPLTKKAKCIQSCTNKYIARRSREVILHLWSKLKATSKFNVEFSSTKQTDTPVRGRGDGKGCGAQDVWETWRAKFNLSERTAWEGKAAVGMGCGGTATVSCCLLSHREYKDSASCSRTRTNGHKLQQEKFQLPLLYCDGTGCPERLYLQLT